MAMNVGRLNKSDLEEIMFGFGDAWPADNQSLQLIHMLVVDYIKTICSSAVNVANVTGKLTNECFLYQIRKDPVKYERITQLLKVHKELGDILKEDFYKDDV